MPEERLNNIRPKFRDNLEDLSRKWEGLTEEEQRVEIICLFEEIKYLGFSKEQFFDEAAKCFDVNAQTIIRLWVDSFEAHGPAFFKVGFKPTVIDIKPDLPIFSQAAQTAKRELPPQDLLGVLKQPLPEKPKEKVKPAKETEKKEKLTVKYLIASKKCGHFTKEDVAFTYKNLKIEWVSFSQFERALVLRELFRLESAAPNNAEIALKKLISKIKFITRDQLLGYLEIGGRPDSLRYFAGNNFLDDKAVSAIGSMRLSLGDLFKVRELAIELNHAIQKDKKPGEDGKLVSNLTEDGHFKIEVFEHIRQKFERSLEALSGLIVGETYVIDPNSTLAKEYEGYIGDTFQFIEQDDKRLTECRDLRKKSSQAFFVGRRKRIFVIDYKAVCRPAEVKKKSDF